MRPKTSPRPVRPFTPRIHTCFLPPEPLDPRIAPAILDVGMLGGVTGFAIAEQVTGDGHDDLLLATPDDGETFLDFGMPADDSIPALHFEPLTVPEGNRGIATSDGRFFLSNPSASPASFIVSTVDGSAVAFQDYIPVVRQTITFAPGQTEAFLPVSIIGNVLDQDNRGFSLSLSSPEGLTFPGVTSSIGIVDDDLPPILYIDNTSVVEGNEAWTVANVRVRLLGPSGKTIVLNYQTSDGTADSTDYLETSGRLVIPPGETFAEIPVTIFGDRLNEADEHFVVTLSEPVNVAVRGSMAYVTILDFDPPEVFSKKFSYHDADGDYVTVKTDQGAWLPGDFFLEPAGSSGGFRLARLDPGAHVGDFANANISIEVEHVPGGDGRASIGRIEMGGVDLRSVKIDGHLDSIRAGDGDASSPGLKRLKVDSLGGVGAAASEFIGGAAKITVAGDVSHARLLATGDGAGFGKVKVHGNWIASDLAAGAGAGSDGLFGTRDDVLLSTTEGLVARISKIVIGGVITGTSGGSDHFGFVAAEIGKFKEAGIIRPLIPGKSEVIILSQTEDVILRELLPAASS